MNDDDYIARAETLLASGRKSQATELVEGAEGLSLFHCEDEAYADINVNGHRETWPLRSKKFRGYLTRQFYVRHNKTPGSQAVEDALRTLSGKALFESSPRCVYTRIAEHDGAIYIDLCDDTWRAIQVTASGWRIVDEPPVRFIRRKGMRSLPVPEPDGDPRAIWDFLNVANENDRLLILAWLVQALRPQGPYPVIVLQGEQGTAKTTTARVLAELVDPKAASVRTCPRSEHDLLIAALNGWVVSLDNLSKLPVWLSDALCRLSTGGGFSTRELYSDTDEVLIDATRPVVLNGIDNVAARPDLIDRAVIITLSPIPDSKRRPEAAFWKDFHLASGRIFGGLLDALSQAIRDEPGVRLDNLPRMADFAVWATAAETRLGYRPGAFMDAFNGSRQDAILAGLEGSRVALAIMALIEAQREWEGTVKELLTTLEGGQGNIQPRGWPSSPKALSSELRRLAASFRFVGVEIELDDHRRRDGYHVKIERVREISSPSSLSSRRQEKQEVTGEHGVNVGEHCPSEVHTQVHTDGDDNPLIYKDAAPEGEHCEHGEGKTPSFSNRCSASDYRLASEGE